MYNMQKQNTPFNPGAQPMNTTTPISAMIKSTPANSNGALTTISTTVTPTTTNSTTTSANAASNTSSAVPSSTTTAASTTTTTTTTTTATSTTTTAAAATTSSNSVSAANPIATISSSTLGLPRQLNHSLFKLRQTPEQQRGLLPTPPIA
jgi:hypothetical protein